MIERIKQFWRWLTGRTFWAKRNRYYTQLAELKNQRPKVPNFAKQTRRG